MDIPVSLGMFAATVTAGGVNSRDIVLDVVCYPTG